MEMKFEHRLTEVEERAKSNQHRLEKIEKRQDDIEELVTTVKVLAVREEAVEKTVNEISDDIKTIKEKPAKRWEAIVTQIVSIIVAAVAGFILAKFGL